MLPRRQGANVQAAVFVRSLYDRRESSATFYTPTVTCVRDFRASSRSRNFESVHSRVFDYNTRERVVSAKSYEPLTCADR